MSAAGCADDHHDRERCSCDGKLKSLHRHLATWEAQEALAGSYEGHPEGHGEEERTACGEGDPARAALTCAECDRDREPHEDRDDDVVGHASNCESRSAARREDGRSGRS